MTVTYQTSNLLFRDKLNFVQMGRHIGHVQFDDVQVSSWLPVNLIYHQFNYTGSRGSCTNPHCHVVLKYYSVLQKSWQLWEKITLYHFMDLRVFLNFDTMTVMWSQRHAFWLGCPALSSVLIQWSSVSARPQSILQMKVKEGVLGSVMMLKS